MFDDDSIFEQCASDKLFSYSRQDTSWYTTTTKNLPLWSSTLNFAFYFNPFDKCAVKVSPDHTEWKISIHFGKFEI